MLADAPKHYHPLLEVLPKTTHDVDYAATAQRLLEQDCDETERGRVQAALDGLTAERKEVLGRLREARHDNLQQTREAVWVHAERAEKAASHLPQDDTPSYVWTDSLAERKMAAEVKSIRVEVPSLIMSLAAVYCRSAAAWEKVGQPPLEGAKQLLSAAGLYRFIAENYANDAVFDLKKPHLDICEAVAKCQASHCFYLSQVNSGPKAKAKLAVDCLTQYTALTSQLRVMEGFNSSWHATCSFYAALFRQLYWIHVAEAIKKDLKDPAVEDRLGNAILGMRGAVQIRLTLPGGKEQQAFSRLASGVLDQAAFCLRFLEEENAKVYHVRLPKELADVVLRVSQELKPKEVSFPGTCEDPLAFLPPAAAASEFAAYKTQLLSFISDEAAKARHRVTELHKELSNMKVAGVLASQQHQAEGLPPSSVLPPALREKLADIEATCSGNPPLRHLTASLETMREVAAVCKGDLEQAETKYTSTLQRDEAGFEKYGARWRATNKKFSENTDAITYKAALEDYKQRLASAQAADVKVEGEIREAGETLQLLEGGVRHQEEALQGLGGVGGSHGDAETAELLGRLQEAVGGFEGACMEAEAHAEQLEQGAQAELVALMPVLLVQDSPTDFLRARFDQHKARSSDAQAAVQVAELALQNVAGKKQQLDELLAAIPDLQHQREQSSAQLLDRLAQAVAAFYSISSSVAQGKDFYQGMAEVSSSLRVSLQSLATAVEASSSELERYLGMENQQAATVQADRAYAERLAREEEDEQRRRQQQQQQQQQPQQAYQAPSDAQIYASASAPPMPQGFQAPPPPPQQQQQQQQPFYQPTAQPWNPYRQMPPPTWFRACR